MPENTLDATMSRLDRLVATWNITGDASGVAAFRWSDDGTSLVHEATLDLDGAQLIYTQVFAQQRRDDDVEIVSRLYTMAGHAIDHVIQIHDDTITAVAATPRYPCWSVALSPDNRSYTCQWKDTTGEREFLATKVDDEPSR